MKKVRSPQRDKAKTDLSVSIKNNIKKQLQKPYRPITDLFAVANEQQKKTNANSIKKVLKELTDLKRQLRELKSTNRTNSQGLDMSVCRKLTAERKSPSSPHQRFTGSHSSSRNKNNSNTKEISTQTKQPNKEINEFSFSIHSKSAKKQQKQDNYSEQEDSEDNQYPLRKRSQISTKRIQSKPIEAVQSTAKHGISQRIAAIEASQIYERYLNSLKHNIDTIPISSALLSTQDKLKLNIEAQRFSKNIARIPIYINKPQQYYQTIQLYARSLNNQLNNLILLLNRTQAREPRLQQNNIGLTNQQKPQKQICTNCEQSEKRGFEKTFKRQLKRYQKQVNRLQEKLENKHEQISKASQVISALMKDIDRYKQNCKQSQRLSREWQNRYNQLKIHSQKIQSALVALQAEKIRETNRSSQLEVDLKYYKQQLQKIKQNVYQRPNQNEPKPNHLQLKHRQLELYVAEIKGKEQLYNEIIKEKNMLIEELKEQKQHRQTTPFKHDSKSKQKITKLEYSEDQSIDSAEYYRQQAELNQKHQLCESQALQIQYLKEHKIQMEIKHREVLNNLQLCLGQIDKLHGEIDLLHEANERYKDKCLKAKITTQKKTKKQSQSQAKKTEAFKEINDLIKQHRDALAKDKK